MGLQISISKSDLSKSQLIPQGWQKFDIVGVAVKSAKPKENREPSTNYVYTLRLHGDPNQREIDHYFNSQAIGFMGPFIAAVTGKSLQEVINSINTDTLTFDVESPVGKTIRGKVKHDPFNNRMTNKLEDFASLSENV